MALAGLAFIVLVGWRLTPQRAGQASNADMFDTASYLVELKVGEDAKANGLTLQQLREEIDDAIPVLAVVRDEKRHAGYAFYRTLKAGDILLLEADPDELKLLEGKAGLSVVSEPEDTSEDQAHLRITSRWTMRQRRHLMPPLKRRQRKPPVKWIPKACSW